MNEPSRKNSKSPAKSSGPPTTNEITDALEAAGYPFELRVYRQFEDAGMDPVFSFRYRADEVSQYTKEIDVLARLHARQQYSDGKYAPTATTTLLFVAEIKRLHRAAFVGFRGEAPTLHQRRCERAAPTVGLPSWQVPGVPYDNANDLLIGAGGAAECFDPVNDRPYCVQWATVKPDKKNERFEAVHDEGSAEDLQRLIRSSMLLARETALHMLDFGVRTAETQALCPEMTFYWPLFVVDAPLHVYDPANRSLVETDWFTLRVGTDLSGKAYYRPIDVVSASGLATIITHYKLTRDRLADWLKTRARDVAGAAHGQVILHRGDQHHGAVGAAVPGSIDPYEASAIDPYEALK